MILIKLKPMNNVRLCTLVLSVLLLLLSITGVTTCRTGKYADESEIAYTQPYEQTPQNGHIEDNANLTDDETLDSTNTVQYYTEQDAIDIAKVLYHECRGIPSKTEQACVAWTVLNRVDKYDSTVYSIVRAPYQFAFYDDAPVWDELLDLAYDVLERWNREKNGETNVGRVLPKEYTYFEGRNGHNYFRDAYQGSYNVWDYSIQSPYQDN